MERPSVDLVTVSREFGAGGSELAAALGRELGWYDLVINTRRVTIDAAVALVALVALVAARVGSGAPRE